MRHLEKENFPLADLAIKRFEREQTAMTDCVDSRFNVFTSNFYERVLSQVRMALKDDR